MNESPVYKTVSSTAQSRWVACHGISNCRKMFEKTFYLEFRITFRTISNVNPCIWFLTSCNFFAWILVLQFKNVVFKPVQKFPKGKTEILFYEELFGLRMNDNFTLLKKFVPKYIGLFINSINAGNYLFFVYHCWSWLISLIWSDRGKDYHLMSTNMVQGGFCWIGGHVRCIWSIYNSRWICW